MALWNLEEIHKLADTEKLLDSLRTDVKNFAKHRDELTAALSTEKFMSILGELETLIDSISRLGAHADLWSTENTSDSKRNAHAAKVSEECALAGNEVIFFSLWFKGLDDASAKKYIDASGGYRYYLGRLRAYKNYTLKEKEEQIITLKDLTGAQAVSRLYDIITNRFRFKFEGKELSQEEVNQHKHSPLRKRRVACYDTVLGRYGQEEEVIGEIYKNIVNDWRNESIKLRGYASPIAVRNHANDVPDSSVDALLKVVRRNATVFQDYFALKKKLIKLSKMDRYDLYAPYSPKEQSYPFELSKKITLETYKRFDTDAHAYAKRIFDDKHVHSELVKNKRTGAFCYSITPSMAPYIMLNHVGKLNDLFTMMHEFGHGIHSLAAQKQNHFTFHSTLPLAETASIFGEMLLSKRLLSESGTQQKIAVLTKMLDSQYGSIGRQAFFVLFEKEAHEKIASGATIEELNALYMSNLKEQFGSMKVPSAFRHEWKYIPHIYHSPFYCYSYAFGNLLVLALYNMFEKEGKSFTPKYMKLLSYGGSKAPAEILSEIGIDITKEAFWQSGFEIIKREIADLRKLTNNGSPSGR